MDSLSVYFDAMWQEAQRPLPKTERPSTRGDIAAAVRGLRRMSKRTYSLAARQWRLRRNEQ
jgi:hypothetical protein